MTRRPEIDVLVLVPAIALAGLPLVPVFGPVALLRGLVGGVVVGTLVALVSARLRWGVWVSVAVAFAAFLVAGPAVAVPGATLLHVLPRPEGVWQVLTGAVTSWKQVVTLEPELGTSGNTLVAPFLLGTAASLGALSLALRSRARAGAFAALVPPVVLVVSTLLGTKVAVGPVVSGLVLVVALTSWASWRCGTFAPRRVLSLALVVAVVGALGAVTGPWVATANPRYVLRDEIVPPFDPTSQASPLSAFRKFVKDWSDTPLLTVRGLPAGGQVRLATMDAFDGVVWNVAGAEAAEGSGTFRRVGSEVDTQERSGRQVNVEMTADELPFVWLPTVGWTEGVDVTGRYAARRADLRYNEATGAAVLVGGVPRGFTWTADVVVPAQPDEDALESAAIGSAVLPRPQDVPDAVAVRAAAFAGTASKPALIAQTLAARLHDEGWFSHGRTEIGEARAMSGHGANRVAELLGGQMMVGDGEQYASAMALMARSMGLPARVVLGFVGPAEQQREVTFTGSQIQAWVEIDYAGYGWVSYFPTPDESRTPQQDPTQQQAQSDPQVRQPPPPQNDPVTAPDDDTEQPHTDDNEEQSRTGRLWALVGRLALVGGVPLVLVLGPPLLIAAVKRRRRRRRRQAAEPVARVVGGWDELLDQAVDLRRPLPEPATRRELAVALAGAFPSRSGAGRRGPGIGGPVATLASRADAVVFGGLEPTDEDVAAFWGQVDVALAAMRSAVPRRVRWRAQLSAASVRHRRRLRRQRRRAG
jgi:transglutaminase-like putative cysteine protease